MQWILANGISLRCEVTGNGRQALVLVHELGGTLESWDDVIARLKNDWKIIRYDWRGSGLSEKITDTVTVSDHANDLWSLLDKLGIKEPAVLAGCAVGGAIALQFASMFPASAASVVAMCPATEVTADRREASLAFADRLSGRDIGLVVDSGLAGAYPPEVRKDQARYEAYLAKYRSNDARSYAAVLRMVASQDMEQDLKAIQCGVSVLWGRYDQARPRALTEKVAKLIPNAQFREVDTAHFMPVQAPDLVAEEIDRAYRQN
jgi:3-oxoadipate enol-lactonase